jgi:esterase/lipase
VSRLGGVLLLHGRGRFGASITRLGKAARREGYATFAPSYPYRRPLPEIVRWLAPRVEAFAASLEGPLHIVTHSLGGLVARANRGAAAPPVGRVVMLAPPNRRQRARGSAVPPTTGATLPVRGSIARSSSRARSRRSAAHCCGRERLRSRRG